MKRSPADIRAELGHPVIDCDGHWLEPIPSSSNICATWAARGASTRCARCGAERRVVSQRLAGAPLQAAAPRDLVGRYGQHARQGDRASPALLNERLPELGIDFAIIYPSFGLTINSIRQDELHGHAARAYNRMTADMFGPYRSRLAPAGDHPGAHSGSGDRRARVRGRKSWATA
jgi:hypothetical protein